MGLEDLGGLGALAVALFFVGRAIRGDARLENRLTEYAGGLEKRIGRLERQRNRDRSRIYQLEAILRTAGLPVPAWPDVADDDDPDDPQPPALLVPTQRSPL